MIINFYKTSEQLNFNVHNLEYTKNKTIFSSPILSKTDLKKTSIDQLYSDIICDFLKKPASDQYDDYGDSFEVNENTIKIKYYNQNYAEKCVVFNLFSVDFYLTSNTYIECNRDFFNEEFFKKFEECPYEIHIIEIATIKHQSSDSSSEDEDDEQERKPINSSQIFKSNECVICLTNQPNILFCNCGHICICGECGKRIKNKECPVCKTENTILRLIVNILCLFY